MSSDRTSLVMSCMGLLLLTILLGRVFWRWTPVHTTATKRQDDGGPTDASFLSARQHYDLSNHQPGLFDCVQDLDCVAATCCHARTCVPLARAPDCGREQRWEDNDGTGMVPTTRKKRRTTMCTMDCVEGSMDCGMGRCGCQDGQCVVIWNDNTVPGPRAKASSI